MFDYGKEPWDKLDMEYLKKQIEKCLNEHDGKTPVNQLAKEDYEKFNGVNLQGEAIAPPEPEQDTIALYMIDADQQLSKRFTITKATLAFITRKTQRIIYGTTDPKGRQTKIVLQWEKEKRR